jgi:hypothetical protein
MNRITTIVSARFSNLVARRIPALGRTATARQVEKYRSSGGRKGNFDSYQRFTDRRIPVAVLERRDASHLHR